MKKLRLRTPDKWLQQAMITSVKCLFSYFCMLDTKRRTSQVVDESSQGIQAVYEGKALTNSGMDLAILSDGLKGLARLTKRVSYFLYSETYEHKLELDAQFVHGSVIIPLQVVSHLIQAGEDLFTTKGAQALATIMGFLGWGLIPAAGSLYKAFKKKLGRPLEQSDVNFVLELDFKVDPLPLLRLYNDSEIQAALRMVLRPLREEGIEEFQTRRNGVVIDRVSKADLLNADIAELDAEALEQDLVLNIEKIALLPHLAWHFSDAGISFDAKIDDEDFLARVHGGERFGYGDRMHVILRTIARRDASGRLLRERVIPTVLDVEHAGEAQGRLFGDA